MARSSILLRDLGRDLIWSWHRFSSNDKSDFKRIRNEVSSVEWSCDDGRLSFDVSSTGFLAWRIIMGKRDPAKSSNRFMGILDLDRDVRCFDMSRNLANYFASAVKAGQYHLDRVMIYLNMNNTQVRKPHPLPEVVLTRLAIIALLGWSLLACSKPDEKPASNMSAAREAKKERAELRANIKKIEPFFKPMGKPANSDWLATHNEPGQTFAEYLDADPVKPTKERQKIYVLPLGTFNAKQQKIVDVTAGYLEVFYDLPVVELPAKPLVAVTPNVRQNKLTKTRQIKSGYILNDILKPILQDDAAALIAFTIDDLYPDDSMNYVFGQASLEDRVGVWSLARMDDNTDDRNFLIRTLKIAAHETGHMFSMRHCKKYECLMSGTNHLAETDSRPIDACPECTAKVCWLSDVDQAERYQKLADFCRKNGLTKESDEFVKKSNAVR